MDAKTKTFRTTRGFTLVEMLIVIVIIGVLASLVTAAAVAALRAAKRFAITNEISQLTMALEKYKQERGDYPPDFAGVNHLDKTTRDNARQAVLRHLRKAYPRYQTGASPGAPAAVRGTWDGFVYDVKYASAMIVSNPSTGLDIEATPLDPSSALAFWLGGPPAPDGSTLLAGFSANPANPFARGGSRLPSLFEFDETRLQPRKVNDTDPNNIVYKYIPPNMPTTPMAGLTKAPYVYFRANAGAAAAEVYNPLVASFPQPNVPIGIDTGTCVPYANKGSINTSSGVVTIMGWFNPKTFQIISAGLDGEFSEPLSTNAGYILPNGNLNQKSRFLFGADSNLSSAEDDNLTSFAQGALGDQVK